MAAAGEVTTATDFPALLMRLWRLQHTGPVIVHFAQGHPNVVEIPGEPERIPLAKRPRAERV